MKDTPKNDASTRSHCIFIIQIEATKAGSNVKTVSRVHLVDLSGSESKNYQIMGFLNVIFVVDRLCILLVAII